MTGTGLKSMAAAAALFVSLANAPAGVFLGGHLA